MNKEYPETRIIDWAKEYSYEAQYFITKSFSKLYSRELLDCLLFGYAGVERILKFIIVIYDPINIINREKYDRKYALVSDYSRSFPTLGCDDCLEVVESIFPKISKVSGSINKLGSYRNTIQHGSLIHHKYKDVFDFMVSEEGAYFDIYSSFLIGEDPKINLEHKSPPFEFGFDNEHKKESLLLKILNTIP